MNIAGPSVFYYICDMNGLAKKSEETATAAPGARKLVIVVNPISGTLPKREIVKKAEERLREAGFDVECRLTHYGGHASEIAREAAEAGAYGVIAAGGDGTVNEVASALRDTDTALGIIPLGSGNGLARHIATSIDADHAIDVIVSDNIEACDYGSANGHPFFCTFGLGFDAAVSERFAQMHRRGLGAYLQSAMREYFSFKPDDYEIITPEGTLETKAFILTVANASQYGNNAFIAPRASIRDGLFDITILSSPNPVVHAIAGIRLFTGNIGTTFSTRTLRTSEAIIRRTGTAAHADGENVEMPEEIKVVCHKGGLKIFTDPDKSPFRPIATPFFSMRDDIHYMLRTTFERIKR